jgi:hypothetical protein
LAKLPGWCCRESAGMFAALSANVKVDYFHFTWTNNNEFLTLVLFAEVDTLGMDLEFANLSSTLRKLFELDYTDLKIS